MSLIGTITIQSTGFTPPGPGDFNLPPIGADKTFEWLGQTHYLGVTKPMLQLVLSSLVSTSPASETIFAFRVQLTGVPGYSTRTCSPGANGCGRSGSHVACSRGVTRHRRMRLRISCCSR